MAADHNMVSLVGRLTRDPELRQTAGGTSNVRLGLGVTRRRKDSSGEWGDAPSYFDIEVFGKQAESIAQYTRKGSQVAVSGELEQQRWETPGGDKRSKVVVIASSVQFLGSRSDNQGPSVSPNDAVSVPTDDDDPIPF